MKTQNITFGHIRLHQSINSISGAKTLANELKQEFARVGKLVNIDLYAHKSRSNVDKFVLSARISPLGTRQEPIPVLGKRKEAYNEVITIINPSLKKKFSTLSEFKTHVETRIRIAKAELLEGIRKEHGITKGVYNSTPKPQSRLSKGTEKFLNSLEDRAKENSKQLDLL